MDPSLLASLVNVLGTALGSLVQALIEAIRAGDDVKTVEALAKVLDRPELNDLRDALLEARLTKAAQDTLPAGPPRLPTP